MSHHDKHTFDPDCPGCQPVIVDPTTGQVLPRHHPAMLAALALWKDLPFDQQEALHRVWVQNSRDPADMAVMQAYGEALQNRMEN